MVDQFILDKKFGKGRQRIDASAGPSMTRRRCRLEEAGLGAEMTFRRQLDAYDPTRAMLLQLRSKKLSSISVRVLAFVVCCSLYQNMAR